MSWDLFRFWMLCTSTSKWNRLNVDQVKEVVFRNRNHCIRICLHVRNFMYFSPEHFGRQSDLYWTVAKFPPTPTHSTLPVPEFLAVKQTNVMPHPLCLPDLVLCDFFPFLKVKKLLMGRKFTVDDCLTTGMRSEKCVIRRFRHCVNSLECTYTNLNSTV
jgi:hypothetical protein